MSAEIGLRPVGDQAVIVEVRSNADVHALANYVRTHFSDAVTDVVPGHVSVLLRWRTREPPHSLLESIQLSAWDTGLEQDPAEPLIIHVRYDGPDLEAIAASSGLGSHEQVITHHTAPTYRVAFTGFTAGFAYLVGGDPRLNVPRRNTPRERVSAGAVAVAGPYTAIYPRSSPGGWHLLGTSDVVLFDPDRDPPALLTPGRRVRLQCLQP